MGCQCEIDVDVEGDRAKFIKISNHKARKQYTCMECGRTISMGENYEKVKWCGDEGFSTWQTCAECQEIRDCFMCSYYYGGVWEEMYEHFRWEPEQLCIGKLDALSPKARDKMIQWIDELLESIETS